MVLTVVEILSSPTGFEDYGDYWRYNYETFEDEPTLKYTRDDLMQDVRTVYKEVSSSICVTCFRPLHRQAHQCAIMNGSYDRMDDNKCLVSPR